MHAALLTFAPQGPSLQTGNRTLCSYSSHNFADFTTHGSISGTGVTSHFQNMNIHRMKL